MLKEKWVEQKHVERISFSLYVNDDKTKEEKRGKEEEKKYEKILVKMVELCDDDLAGERFCRFSLLISLLSNINHKNMEDYLP
jgi:hypothetical protein